MNQLAIPETSEYRKKKDLKEHQDGEHDIIVTCPKCKKILFEGKKREAKRLIIYCTDCSE